MAEGDQPTSLDEVLKQHADVTQKILAEPTAEEKELARVTGIDKTLRELVGRQDLKDFLTAYNKQTNKPATAPLVNIRLVQGVEYEGLHPTLRIDHDGKLSLLNNIMEVDESKQKWVNVELRTMEGHGNSYNAISAEDGPLGVDASGNEELIVDGKAFVWKDPGNTARGNLLGGLFKSWKEGGFTEATAESIQQTLVEDLTAKGQELAPNQPPAPQAPPTPPVPPTA